MKTSFALVSLLGLAAAAPQPRTPVGCGVDTCFWKNQIPKDLKPLITTFCKALVGKQPCSSSVKPIFSTLVQTLPGTTIQQTINQTPQPTTVVQSYQSTKTEFITIFATVTNAKNTVCSSTITVSATSEITYPTFTPIGVKPRADSEGFSDEDAVEFERLMQRSSVPFFASNGCKKIPTLQKIKDACGCFLAVPAPNPSIQVVTSKQPGATVIQTVVQTLPAQAVTVIQSLPPHTITSTVTETKTNVETFCTSTSVSTVVTGAFTACGAPGGTYASATTGDSPPSCVQPANAPSGSVNAYHRIEGGDEGTVFEGCIYAGPRSINLPSGGEHQCGASQGTSITSQTDAAAKRTGFTYDGTFSPSFNDYYITRIGSTTQTGNQYWGVLNNGVFTTSGGCGAQVRVGDSSLWQWDAFNLNTLLTITPSYAIVAGGSQISITVSSRSPNGGGSSPFSGASLSGQQGGSSDANGKITFTAPIWPGCYQYKASGNGAGRSNAFYLNVVPEFPYTLI